MQRWLSALCVAAGTCFASAVDAADVREPAPGTCVSELGAEPNQGGGIPTGSVARYIALKLCDGDRSALAVSDGGLLLEDDLRKTWDSRIVVPEEGHPLSIFSNTDWTVYPRGAGVLPDSQASFGADGLSAWLVRPTDRARTKKHPARSSPGVAILRPIR